MGKATICIVGMGFVGLTTAAVFAQKGVMVYGVDSNSEKIKSISRLQLPFFETGLQGLIKKGLASKKLILGTDIDMAVTKSDVIFICVGTPMKGDGSVDLSYVEAVSREIGKTLRKSSRYKVISVKSTVPPKTTEDVVIRNLESESGKRVGKDFGVTMTPEFLKEGSAVKDTLNPHLIVIGANDAKSVSSVKKLLSSLYRKTPLLKTNIVSAEMIKYANNSFLATKISFINTIANICNHVPGTDVDVIAQAIGTDPRIGPQFLVAGPGYGGSCFPKDVAGFISYCKGIGYDPSLIEATSLVNKQQVMRLIELILQKLGTIENRSITVLGTAFKKNTDDIRESVSIKLVMELIKLGAKVRVHDPMALENTKQVFQDKVAYPRSIRESFHDSDCVVLMTDWDEYKSISSRMILQHTKRCAVIDTRRVLQVKSGRGIDYVAVGRS